MAAAVLEVAEREEQLVAFHLANEIYGVDISAINEIIRLREITQIPRANPDIEGVINLRGKIVPILDLRRRLGLPAAERTGVNRIIVVENGGCTVGLVVDGVTGVLRIADTSIEPPSKLICSLHEAYIRGVGKVGDKLVILLNMDFVLKVDLSEL